ncbi:alpha/beta hydrolase [Novosphingobium sp. 9]|uniref:alpha/beta hydrolase n=1 Tax=Novosphingobium sp. 9 TaxID=2025349 RepID=UPI0021B5EFFD|nr:alpha/beta fold hydrolase [Novosphingobium sp. 9]
MTDLTAAAQHAGASLFRIDAGIGRDLVGLDWNREGASAGCILFSHGAASAPWKYAPMIDDWRARGYRVLAPLHVDSTDHPDTLAYPGLASWRARLEDMRSLAQLTDQPHIAAGHSYGALVALTLGGARGEEPADIARSCGDATPSRHTQCVLAFSPPRPFRG